MLYSCRQIAGGFLKKSSLNVTTDVPVLRIYSSSASSHSPSVIIGATVDSVILEESYISGGISVYKILLCSQSTL